MHKSRRVDVGIQGSTWAGRASTSTPWQRSKNTLVRDDWRLQNGALSPKSKDAVYNRPTRAHTSLGHQGGALSPVLSQASIGSDHHSSLKERSFGPPRSAYEAGSLSQESMSKILRTPALNASLSASKDIAPRSPSFWVQERYFTHPKQRSTYELRDRRQGVSQYGKFEIAEGGRPLEQWVASNPPPKWPPFPNWKRPHERKKEWEEDVSSAEYLAGLHAKTFAALEGSISCMMNGNERFVRDSNMRMAETLEVAALVTPRIAVKEQILEEALRQVQEEEVMDEINKSLHAIDNLKSGRVSVSAFTKILSTAAKMQPAYIKHLVQAAGTEPGKNGQDEQVRYQIFLDMLRIARNRKMASLMRSKQLTRQGLKRWQSNNLVRVISSWKTYCKAKRIRRTASR